jgi:hypothetical protein
MSPGNWSDTMKISTISKPLKPPVTDDVELWNRDVVMRFFGGNEKPIHLSTLYRGIANGIYPKPVNISSNSIRWVASECRAAIQRMIAARDEPKKPTRRGRKRRKPTT